MRGSDDRNWELIEAALAAESSGKTPRMFSSRKTLFGIPSALDQELNALGAASGDTPEALPTKAPTATGAALQPAVQQQSDPKTHTASQSLPGSPRASAKATRVQHPLQPVFDGNSRVLILGTMPSPKSRETGFYYNHPQNRFWKVMAALFDEPLPASNDEKRQLALRHGIALWDVLAQCTIEGASDGTIAECVPNNLAVILDAAPIEAVFCTGAKAAELYRRHCEATTGIAGTRLPSTSPANAAVSLPQLIEAYRAILPYCIA